MTLFMLQLPLDLARLLRWAEGERLLAPRQDDDLGYALHAALRAAFDTLAPAPFVLERRPRRPAALLAYSRHDPGALREQAQSFAAPEVVALLGLGAMADKPMPARFASGRRLGFSARVRPTVRTDRDGQRDASRERDAFLAAVEPASSGEGPSRGEVYQAWLARRLREGGAEPEQMALDRFQLATTLRRDRARKLRPLGGPDARFSGVLTIADPERFAALLAHGIGRHAAFGFGMLLLKPA